MSKVLCVGLCCVDVVIACDQFPVEDSDCKVSSACWHRGGNSSNTATVLSVLGQPVDLATTMPAELGREFLVNDLHQYKIGDPSLWRYACNMGSFSYVLINRQNGSRTIMNALGLYQEYPFESFTQIDLALYRWVHFEGRRNHDDLHKMIHHVVLLNESRSIESRIYISVEFEKTRFCRSFLSEPIDLALISKEYAISLGATCKEQAVVLLLRLVADKCHVLVTWGSEGAAGYDALTRRQFSVGGRKDIVVRNTLGAGDTFNAAVVGALLRNADLERACVYACRVAGTKCELDSFGALADHSELSLNCLNLS